MAATHAMFNSLEKNLVPLPIGGDPYEVAAIILNYLSAFQLIHGFTRIKESDCLLIHGDAGGVGTALLQLCQDEKVNLFGTVSNKNKHKVISMDAQLMDY